MSADFLIEVYNVPPGPGAELPVEAPANEPIAYMRVPAGGTAPNLGDLITLSIGGTRTERLRVVARHHLAESVLDAENPAHVEWSKMWIFVTHA